MSVRSCKQIPLITSFLIVPIRGRRQTVFVLFSGKMGREGHLKSVKIRRKRTVSIILRCCRQIQFFDSNRRF